MAKTDFSKPAYPYRNRRPAAPADIRDQSLQAAIRNLSIVMARQASPFDRRACKLALDWLNSLKTRLEQANASLDSVHMLEISSSLANSDGEPVPGTERLEVFAWNARTISDEKAEDVINSGMAGFSDRIVKMTPEQSRNLFPGQYETETRKTGG